MEGQIVCSDNHRALVFTGIRCLGHRSSLHSNSMTPLYQAGGLQYRKYLSFADPHSFVFPAYLAANLTFAQRSASSGDARRI